MPESPDAENRLPVTVGAGTPHLLPGQPGFQYRDDGRYASRRRNEAERKARLIKEQAERLERERLVLSAAAGGKSLRAISRDLDIPQSTVRRLYGSAMDRVEVETTAEFTKSALHRLGMLLSSAWAPAMGGKVESQRVALEITKEMNKIGGIYPPAQQEVDLTVQVSRRVTVSRAADHLAAVRAARMRSTAIDVEAGPVTNGHANGNGAGYTELAS
jgi:hypothetical protein